VCLLVVNACGIPAIKTKHPSRAGSSLSPGLSLEWPRMAQGRKIKIPLRRFLEVLSPQNILVKFHRPLSSGLGALGTDRRSCTDRHLTGFVSDLGREMTANSRLRLAVNLYDYLT